MNPYDAPQTTAPSETHRIAPTGDHARLIVSSIVVAFAFLAVFIPLGIFTVIAIYVTLVFGRLWTESHHATYRGRPVTSLDVVYAILSSLAIGFLCLIAAAIGFVATCTAMNLTVDASADLHWVRLMLACGSVICGLVIYWLAWPRTPIDRARISEKSSTTASKQTAEPDPQRPRDVP